MTNIDDAGLDYTIYTLADDGAKLWINHAPVIHEWRVKAIPTESASGPVKLQRGHYPLQLDFFSASGPARVALSWSNPFAPKALIPQAALYPSVDGTPVRGETNAIFLNTDTATKGSWMGVYGADGYELFNVADHRTLPAYVTAVTRSSTEPDYRFLRRVQADAGFGRRPIVSVIHEMPGCANVLADDRSGAYAATMHLLELGHRHLVHFFTIPTHPVFHRRAEGITQALRDWGLDPAHSLHPCPAMLLGPMGPNTHQATLADYLHGPEAELFATQIAEFLTQLRATPEVTAILALNDVAALQIWQILTEAGWRVPDDYSLVGFDDVLPRLDAHGTNQLTTVRVPLEAIGARAAELLLEMITTGADDLPRITLPVELIPRASTAPVAR